MCKDPVAVTVCYDLFLNENKLSLYKQTKYLLNKAISIQRRQSKEFFFIKLFYKKKKITVVTVNGEYIEYEKLVQLTAPLQ